ncbi:hypothetical protein D3C75_487130 [compost metagenome]
MTQIHLCQGICRSQVDDYCGMHMSDETCPACEHVWIKAHEENDRKDMEAMR